jgi:hypothetical protein
MPTGSGLDAQFGYKLETTVGTPVTVDKFLEFNSESLSFDPGYIEPEGLRVGVKFKRGSRLVQSRKMVSGSMELNYATRLMGGLWKAALGSSVTTPAVVTAGQSFSQVHQTGDLLGKSMTLQVGRPEPSTQVVKAHTYAGCKVTGWEWSVADNETAKFSLDFDGWDEATATALATASFVSPVAEFNFSQASVFSIGGTIGGANPLTYTGGSAVSSIVKSLSFKGDNALATERFGLGNAGVKKEQLENGIPTITGTLEAEYLQSEWYTPFKANTSTSLNVKLEGGLIGSSSDKDTIEFIVPQIRVKNVSPQVSGPDLVTATVEFEVYSDGTNNPFQAKIISGDSTAI